MYCCFFLHFSGHSVDEKIEEFETVLISLKDDMEDLNTEISNLNITVNDLPIHSKLVRTSRARVCACVRLWPTYNKNRDKNREQALPFFLPYSIISAIP